MILIDANLLIYACVPSMSQHSASQAWLDERLGEETLVGLPWQSLAAFLRITTNPRLVHNGPTVEEGWAQVEQWLALPNVWTPVPGRRHATILGEILKSGRLSNNLVMDAHLAAVAVEHGLTLCSADQDFARFPGLRWENPLAA